MDTDQLYELAREKELIHGPFMKVEGQVHIANDYILSELELSEKGQESLSKYIYHPAFVDASFFMLGAFLFNDSVSGVFKKDSVFIPMYLKEFIPFQKIEQNKLYVCLKKDDLHTTAGQEIFRCNIYLYSEEGDQLASIIGYTTKEVREEKSIRMDSGNKSGVIIEEEGQDEDDNPNVVFKDRQEITDLLINTIAQRTKKDYKEINLDDEFFELGLDSRDILEMVKVLESKLNVELYPTILIEYNSIRSISNYLYDSFVVVES